MTANRHLQIHEKNIVSLDAAHREMTVGTGTVGVAARVDKGHQGVGGCADYSLQVDAGIRQRRDGQSSLFAQLQHGARRGEPRALMVQPGRAHEYRMK